VRKLLLGTVGTQDLIEAEKISSVGFPLKLVAVTGEPHADLRFGRIARLTDAGSCGDVLPCPAQIRENVFETIESMLNAVLGFEPSDPNMTDPGVNRMHSTDDHVIQVLASTAQEIGKTLTCNSHKPKVFDVLNDPGGATQVARGRS